MEAGRDLDLAIAELVMGWKRTKLSYQLAINYDRLQVHPKINDHFPLQPPEFFEIPEDGKDRKYFRVPKYSADIAEAWKVIEMMKSKNFFMDIKTTVYDFEQIKESGYTVTFSGSDIFSYFAKTAPHSICMAAIRAMGIQE